MQETVSLLGRRLRAARQLLFLIRHAGGRTVGVAALVHMCAGLAVPLVVLGSGTVVSGATGHGASIATGVVLCAVGLVVQQLAAPLQVSLFAAVQLRVDAYVSQRLIDTVGAANDLRAVEETSVRESVAEANSALEQRAQTPGSASAGALALIARYAALTGTLALLAVVVSVPIAALGFAIALINRIGQTLAFSQWSAANGRFAALRRRQEYLRSLAIDPKMARDIRMLGLTDWLETRYRADARRYLRVVWWARRRVYGASFLYYATATVVGSGVLLVAAMTVMSGRGEVSPGAVAVVLQAALACVMFGSLFPEADVHMQYGRIAWEAIIAIEETLKTHPTAARKADVAVTSDSGDMAAEIAFDNVFYGYTPETDVLRGVNLRLRAGRSTALVGVNGAGKSTLVKLLTGYYVPRAGQMTLDGMPLSDPQRADWQRRVAIVFQDYACYELTLRQNLIMQALVDGTEGDEHDAELAQLLQDVGLGDLLDSLPLGLDTPLSRLLPGGTDLSGGQWQRLALARALFAVSQGARLLVMDEPTSQMDARGEAEFYTNFLRLTRGITTLVISHRFSSVRQADVIAMLEDGLITELGSHSELMARSGVYARMFAAQSSRYTSDPESGAPMGQHA